MNCNCESQMNSELTISLVQTVGNSHGCSIGICMCLTQCPATVRSARLGDDSEFRSSPAHRPIDNANLSPSTAHDPGQNSGMPSHRTPCGACHSHITGTLQCVCNILAIRLKFCLQFCLVRRALSMTELHRSPKPAEATSIPFLTFAKA